MFVVSDSAFGTVIIGKIEKMKQGSGGAAERLTILTLSDCNVHEKGRKIKCLCWNGKKIKLSNRAQKFEVGDIITARVEFDVGDPNKCTAFEMKKSGLYSLKDTKGKDFKILFGRIKGITSMGFQRTVLHMPIYNPKKKGNNKNHWYSLLINGNEDYLGHFVVVKGHEIYHHDLWSEIKCSNIAVLYD